MDQGVREDDKRRHPGKAGTTSMTSITKEGIQAEMREAQQPRKCNCCGLFISHHFEPHSKDDDRKYDLVCGNCHKRTPWNMEAMFHRIQATQVIG